MTTRTPLIDLIQAFHNKSLAFERFAVWLRVRVYYLSGGAWSLRAGLASIKIRVCCCLWFWRNEAVSVSVFLLDVTPFGLSAGDSCERSRDAAGITFSVILHS